MTVDEFIEQNECYKTGLSQLRSILLDLGLEESIKWNFPVYSFHNKNIVGLGAFNHYFGIWFFQGVFLKDESGALLNAQEGKTKAMRQWRFASDDEVDTDLVRLYVLEAINNQKAGLAVKPVKKPLVIPDELNQALEKNVELKALFDQLSLSKKREFAGYILEAKRPETKLKRLNKIIPMILENISLYDQYR